MKLIATCARGTRASGQFCIYLALLGLVAGCGAIDKPVRPTLYDFGAGLTAAALPDTARLSPSRPPLPALVLADIEAAGALDGSAVLYRLGYADGNQLRPYAQARWSAPPPQVVRQRLREQLGRERVVLNPGESGAALARTGADAPRVLRIELEEFSHYFDSPTLSFGLLRLRATLLEATAGGEKLLDQRAIVMQRPAASADAPGGVRALAEATDAAAQAVSQWLQTAR